MILTTLCALLTLSLSATGDTGPHTRQDWIDADVKRIEQLKAALTAPDLDIESLVAQFGSIERRDDVDAGFGVRRVRMHLYGGYTTIWIEILAERGSGEKKSRVAELRARQLGPPERWSGIQKTFAKAWGEAATPMENGFQLVRRDEVLAKSLRTRTAEALGGEARVDVPQHLRLAFELLSSPFDEVVIGFMYGYDGVAPPGLAQIEALAKAERFDLVRAVLRGINPEARLYAAWALRRRSTPLDPADEKAIEAILALPHELHVTEGCEQSWRSPREALKSLAGGK